jgi:alpha-1,3-rhamnosyl/mannosyltransferase
MTVHDLDAVDYPTLHAPRAIATTRAQLASLQRVRVVVTNSETTKRAVVRHGVPEEKVVVALLGLSPLPPAGPARLEGIDRYVLCVGGLNLRKGQDVLLRAWARRRPDGTALVLAGPDGYGSAEMHNFAASLPGDRPVRFEGLVDDRRLSALYAGAAAVCAPSRSEGFGLPVLEALAAGVPVVATDIEAFREVAADTALFVPPEDEGALAEALDAALDGSPDVRQRVAAGRGRARQFTWRRCVAATIDAYRQAIG